MSGDTKLIASASAGHEHDPLLTPEQAGEPSTYEVSGTGTAGAGGNNSPLPITPNFYQ
jgi:hypothetical protein